MLDAACGPVNAVGVARSSTSSRLAADHGPVATVPDRFNERGSDTHGADERDPAASVARAYT